MLLYGLLRADADLSVPDRDVQTTEGGAQKERMENYNRPNNVPCFMYTFRIDDGVFFFLVAAFPASLLGLLCQSLFAFITLRLCLRLSSCRSG